MASPPTAGGAHVSTGSQSHAFTYTKKGTGKTPDVMVKTYPRSTYDILRYLGALVRYRRDHRNDRPADAAAAPAFPAYDLFVMDRGPFAASSFISVWYRGETYSIPGTSPSSIQVLSLVRQLIALSTSVNALPPSNTVTTVVQ